MAEVLKTIDELNAKSVACTKCLEDKFAGNDGKRHIVLCGFL